MWSNLSPWAAVVLILGLRVLSLVTLHMRLRWGERHEYARSAAAQDLASSVPIGTVVADRRASGDTLVVLSRQTAEEKHHG